MDYYIVILLVKSVDFNLIVLMGLQMDFYFINQNHFIKKLSSTY